MTETAQHSLESQAILDEFFQDCGGNPHFQLAISNRETSEVEFLPIDKPTILIGRSAACDVVLKHWDLSYRHAYFQLLGGRLLAVDLGSRSGTRWEDLRRRSGWLTPGKEITIGPYVLKLVRGASPSSKEIEQASVLDMLKQDGKNFPQASLELLSSNSHSRTGKRLVLKPGVTLIGRSRAAQVRLKHDTVSHVHASLVLTQSGLWVVDLLGRGGTNINGKSVEYARLQRDDVLTIGAFHMHVETDLVKRSSSPMLEKAPSPAHLRDSQDEPGENSSILDDDSRLGDSRIGGSALGMGDSFLGSLDDSESLENGESARWIEIIDALQMGGFGT